MDLSIIIPVTRPGHIKRCLKKIVAQIEMPDQIEIIVVKNNQISLEEYENYPAVKVITLEEMHPSIRRNTGAKAASGNYLAFIDDDVYVSDEWIITFKKYANILDVMCGPIRQSNFSDVGKNIVGHFNQSQLGEGFSDCNFKREKVKYYNVPLCNVILRRSIWERVGGFNEFSDYNIDDAEFFYIASKLNISFDNIPELIVDHDLISFGWSNLKKRAQSRFNTGINSLLYYEIYFQYPALILLWSLLAVGVVLFLALPTKLFLAGVSLTYLFYLVLITFALAKRTKKLLLSIFAFQTLHLVIVTSYFIGCLYFLTHFFKYHPVLQKKKVRYRNAFNL